jgi:hypothetical protein
LWDQHVAFYAVELNPFPYGSPLLPGEGIERPTETALLLRMALGGQNTRLSAPRRYGKTTLIEAVRAAAEGRGLNTVRVDLYGVLSRADVALRLEGAYRNLRGPLARSVDGLLRRTKLKATAGIGPAKVEAESARTDLGTDRYLLDLLDLPCRFFERKKVRTLVVFDEFQDVLQAGDGVDAIIRSRIQHQRHAASYLFAGSHPGMLDELFGDRSRPLYDQARPVVLEPLGALAVADYVEEHFVVTGRSAGRPLDDLIEMAAGHPQRTLMLAHHLWEHTPPGEHASADSWRRALRAVFAELQESYERAWSSLDDSSRAVLAAVASGSVPLLGKETLRDFGLSKATAARARVRLVSTGDLYSSFDGVLMVDPLYGRWIAAGRQSPVPQLAPSMPVRRGFDEVVARSPFGDPDAARVSLGDLGRTYVSVGNLEAEASALARARIVVGRKGAGKTLWLRRLHARAASERSVYAADIDFAPPTTSEIVGLASNVRPELRTEVWSTVWRVALLRSVVSHMQDQAPRWGGQSNELLLKFPRLWPQFTSATSPSSQVRAVLHEHRSWQGLLSYMNDPEWDQAQAAIGELLEGWPPMYFFIDALDEEFRHSPAHWMTFQKGLFYRVMNFLRDPRLGGRLHVVVGLRDVAFHSVLRTEHASRYRETSALQLLQWDAQRMRALLSEKVRGLDDSVLMRPDQSPSVEGWLGLSRVRDHYRNADEEVASYLLRHTRLVPRDLVVMGNALCARTAQAVRAGDSHVSERALRDVVAGTARLFGREQLAICATEIAADLLPDAVPEFGDYTAFDVPGGNSYVEGVSATLSRCLQEVGVDRFGQEHLRALAARLEDELPHTTALTALWHNGLIGYAEESSDVFFTETSDPDFGLPDDRQQYVLHPMALYALSGIRSTVPNPGKVLQGRRNDVSPS